MSKTLQEITEGKHPDIPSTTEQELKKHHSTLDQELDALEKHVNGLVNSNNTLREKITELNIATVKLQLHSDLTSDEPDAVRIAALKELIEAHEEGREPSPEKLAPFMPLSGTHNPWASSQSPF